MDTGEIDKLEESLTKVRDAVLTACGVDGKNGLLSRTRADVADLKADLSGLRKLLWGLALTLFLSFAGTGVKSCVDAERRATTFEIQIQQLEAAVADLSRRVHP